MPLIKNAYTPGQWYTFFFESKNVEQSSYYNNVERKFSSWYSFLQKEQIQGKIYDFLGVPNCFGKINKMQLRKMYVQENSRHNRFNKLDIQVKRIHLNESPQSSSKSFNIFRSKNVSNRSAKNANRPNLMTQNELPKADVQRPIEGENRSSKKYSKPPNQVRLNFPKLVNGFGRDVSCNSASDELSQSDEDIFVESKINYKKTKTIPVSKKTLDNEIKRDLSVDRQLLCGVEDEKSSKKSELSPEIVHNVNSLNLSLSVKKKVEFKNENEYFFFKEANSSATHSSPGEVGTKLNGSPEFNDNSSDEDDNAFDTGFLSPIQDFCSESPMMSQEMMCPQKSDANVASSANEGLKSSQDVDNAIDTGFLSQEFCSVSPLKSQQIIPQEPTACENACSIRNRSSPSTNGYNSSNDGDNAYDTGVLSPAQDLFSSRPVELKKVASPYEPATLEKSENIRNASSRMLEKDDRSIYDDSNFRSFVSSVQDICSARRLRAMDKASSSDPTTSRTTYAKMLDVSNESAVAIERYSASTRGLILSRTHSEHDLSIDWTTSRALSVKSDDEVLSQTSAMTEVFATSIMVDLTIPGALETIKKEYKKMFDTLSSQNPFVARKEGPLDLGIPSTDNRKSELYGNQKNNHTNLNESNTTFRGRRHTFSLTTGLNQDRVTINSQEELMEIRKLNLNSIGTDSIKSTVEPNLGNALSNIVVTSYPQETSPNFEDEMSKIVERVNVASEPSIMSSNIDDGMSKIVEKVDISCDPSEINSGRSSNRQGVDSDGQFESIIVHPNSSGFIDESASNSSNRTLRIKLFSSTPAPNPFATPLPTPKIEKRMTPLPTTKIEKLVTPLGRKRLPLKKRHLLASPKLTFSGFAEENGGIPSKKTLVEDKGEELPMDETDPSAVLDDANCANPNAEDAAMECESAIRHDFPEMHLDVMTTKKPQIDLAYKLSLPHISELFFNDPDVSTKFREGSICFTASRATSSKSTRPGIPLIEEFRAESNPNSSIAHEFQELDLNPGAGMSAAKFFVEDAVTPNDSAMATSYCSVSPSIQSDHSDSEVCLSSPFVKDFLDNTQCFLARENARVSQIYDKETLEPCKDDSDDVSLILKNRNQEPPKLLIEIDSKREFPRQIATSPQTDCRSERSSIVASDVNAQDGSIKSIKWASTRTPSAVAQWRNYETTPMRKILSEKNSSESEDSLRVLPSMSQPKTKSLQPLKPMENFGNISFSSKNITKHTKSDLWALHGDESSEISDLSQKDANVLTLAEERLNKTEEIGATVDEIRRQNTVSGKRMSSIVFSNVIMKPVGADRQSKDYDSLIFKDENSTTFC